MNWYLKTKPSFFGLALFVITGCIVLLLSIRKRFSAWIVFRYGSGEKISHDEEHIFAFVIRLTAKIYQSSLTITAHKKARMILWQFG